ncbi:hypothetical protein D3C76_1110470 [compost metagenome]
MSGEVVAAVCHAGAKRDAKHALYSDFFVQHLADRLHLDAAGRCFFCMRQEVDDQVVLCRLCRPDDIPRTAADLGELLERFLAPAAHELVTHHILKIVNNDEFFTGAAGEADDQDDIGGNVGKEYVSGFRFEVSSFPAAGLEREALVFRVDEKPVIGV